MTYIEQVPLKRGLKDETKEQQKAAAIQHKKGSISLLMKTFVRAILLTLYWMGEGIDSGSL